jgi:hypothetical protein
MQKSGHEILDQFEDEAERKWFHHGAIVYGPLVLLCIGLIFRVQHWPGSRLILFSAMLLIAARSFIFFFSTKRKWFEWIYFFSRIALMATLVYYFAWGSGNKRLMIIALSFFSLGVLVYFVKTRKQVSDTIEKEEDDY